MSPDGTTLRVPNGTWTMKDGRLFLNLVRNHDVEAIPRPVPRALESAQRLMATGSHVQGWFNPGSGSLWLELGESRWLKIQGLENSEAISLLEGLEVTPR
jgi:hypothetical protein